MTVEQIKKEKLSDVESISLTEKITQDLNKWRKGRELRLWQLEAVISGEADLAKRIVEGAKKFAPVDAVAEGEDKGKMSGAGLEKADKAGYVSKLEEIGTAKVDVPASLEKLDDSRCINILSILKGRMLEAGAKPMEMEAQLRHTNDVREMAVETAYLVALDAAKAGRDLNLNINLISDAAALHDESKFTIKNKAGAADMDLIGHNSHSAVDAKVILAQMPAPKGVTNMEEYADAVASAIIFHSTKEFPADLAKGQPDKKQIGGGKVDIIEVFGGSTIFTEGTPAGIAAEIVHSADLAVGVGPGSYKKYIWPHLNAPGVIAGNLKNVEMGKSASYTNSMLESWLGTSIKNYLNMSVDQARDTFGQPELAAAGAYAEFWQNMDAESKAEADKVNMITKKPMAEWTDDEKKTLNAASMKLIDKATAYCEAKKAEGKDGKFVAEYSKKFLAENKANLEKNSAYLGADSAEYKTKIEGELERI